MLSPTLERLGPRAARSTPREERSIFLDRIRPLGGHVVLLEDRVHGALAHACPAADALDRVDVHLKLSATATAGDRDRRGGDRTKLVESQRPLDAIDRANVDTRGVADSGARYDFGRTRASLRIDEGPLPKDLVDVELGSAFERRRR
jgi:hypothetical protein